MPNHIPLPQLKDLEKTFMEFIYKKRLKVVKAFLRNKGEAGGFPIPNLKLHYKSIVENLNGTGIVVSNKADLSINETD